MKQLLEIVKGIFIGIANIIPGVSGGTLAVSMGVYNKIINAVNNFSKDFKNSIKTLLPYIIGIVIGIGALSFIIIFLFENYEMKTISCFICLVLVLKFFLSLGLSVHCLPYTVWQGTYNFPYPFLYI